MAFFDFGLAAFWPAVAGGVSSVLSSMEDGGDAAEESAAAFGSPLAASANIAADTPYSLTLGKQLDF